MRQSNKIIKGCYRLINLKFYKIAKSKLLKYISSKGSRDSEAHALLAQISLIQKDISAAENHLSKSLLIDRNDMAALMAKACIHLINQNSEEALRTYFTVLAIEPSNKLAKLNIERIKKNNNKFGIGLIARKYLIYSYMPTTLKPILLAFFVFVIVFGSYISINTIYPKIRIMFLDKGQRELRRKLKDIYLFEGLENGRIPESAQSPTYSPKEIADMFELAKDKMGSADVNSAVSIINTALNSDINDYLKEQFKRLSLFIMAPDYTLFRNNISYQTVVGDPDIYIGAFVKWNVRVDSFIESEDEDGQEIILARVLVLSSDNKTADGLAELICGIDTKLENNEKIEVYARIKNFDIIRKMTILDSIVIKHLPN